MGELTSLEPEEQRAVRAFVRSARRLFVQLDRDLQREVGLPRAHFEILWFLYQAPGRALRMSELADATGSQPSGTTHSVGRLEEIGYVRRELCPNDRRGWLAVLTKKGTAAIERAAPVYASSLRRHLLAPLSPTQREQLAVIGETVLDELATTALVPQ